MLMIVPDQNNSDDIVYSWDGSVIDGKVAVSSYALNLPNAVRNGIWIKANSGTQDGQITAY